MLLENLKVGTRLGLCFGAMVTLLLIISVLSLTSLRGLEAEVRDIVEDDVTKLSAANNMVDGVNAIAIEMRNALLLELRSDQLRSLDRILEKRALIKKNLDQLEEQVKTVEEGRSELDKVKETRLEFIASQEAFIKLVNDDKGVEAKIFLVNYVVPLQAAYTASINAFISFSNNRLSHVGKATTNLVESDQILVVTMALFALAMAALTGLQVTRSITQPLRDAVNMANSVAKGDLTMHIEVKSKDETGQLFQALRDMNESLIGICTNVRTNTDSISISSQHIAQGNADLSQRTEEQASSLKETASSMEELTSTVRQTAENARQANQLANSASDIAVKGGLAVGDVVHTMASISDSSRKIVDIISVIESIAFQTNILALNAAVEAARAGEQGRGFAVVAGEVRSLAQRSASAAKEIKVLIDDSVSKVDVGSKQVDKAGATMSEIVLAVKRVTDIMAEIAAASSEQSSGIEQVNQAIAQMDEVTQQNAALVEEAAAAAESMQKHAEKLMAAASVFKLNTYKNSTQNSGFEVLPAAIERQQAKTDYLSLAAANDKERLRAERELILASL